MLIGGLYRRGMDLDTTTVFSMFLCGICFLGIVIWFMSIQNLCRISYNLLLSAILLIGIRLVLPVEFYRFSFKIWVPDIFGSVTVFLNGSTFLGMDFPFSIKQLLGWIWAAGIFVMLIKDIVCYVRQKLAIRYMIPVEDPAVLDILKKVQEEYGKKGRFRLFLTDQRGAPLTMGFLHPCVILPDYQMEEQEIYYVLRHELAHCYGRDLWIKLFFEIVKCVLWWNPLIYLIRKKLYSLLELRTDERVLKGTDDSAKTAYVEVLVQTARRELERDGKNNAMLFCGGKGDITLTQRSMLGMDRGLYSRKEKWLYNGAMVLCMILVLLASNITLIPHSDPPDEEGMLEDTEEIVFLSDPGFFFVRNSEGTYDLYDDYEYCVTLEEVFDSRMWVYDSLEEALTNEKENKK